MLSSFRKFFAALARSGMGNVLPMTAAAVFILAGMVGGGVDISRAYMVKNRLQNACDAGTLAGRRAIDTQGFDSAAQAQANLYFNTNFDQTQEGVSSASFTPTTPDSGNTVDGTATATLPTVVMNLFGYRNINLSVTCSASMSVGNSDVVMVLDVTGSMADNIQITDSSSTSSTSSSSGGCGYGGGSHWGGSGGWGGSSGGCSSSGWGGWGGSSSSGGSTTEQKIVALRAAMKNFYTTVASATAGSNARVRYGFVPYSSSVNLSYLLSNDSPETGQPYLDPDYIADTWPIQSRQADYVVWGTTTNGTPSPSGSCSSSWSNYGSATTTISGSTATKTQQQRRTCGSGWSSWYQYRTNTTPGTINHTGSGSFLQWEYKQVTYDTSSYKAFNAVSTLTGQDYSGNPTSVSSTWAGCVEERTSVPADAFTFDATNGIVTDDSGYDPSSDKAWDLDIDAAPGDTEGSYGTAPKWGPMWPEVAYYRTSSTNGYQASSYCPHAAQPLMTMTQSDFDDYADALSPVGSTYHDIGLIWGARLASPQGLFSADVNASPDNGGKVARHIIFMTDGQMDTSTSIQSSWGIESLDRRVTSDGSKTTSDSNHISRYRAICDAIKAKGIRIWVIAFSSGLNDDLSYCASPESAFTANTSDQLNNAFQVIAKNVGELRVVT